MKTKILALAAIALLAAQGCASTGVFNRLSDNQKAASFNAELAANYMVTGELEQAKLKLERALQQDPRNGLANNTYAKLQTQLEADELADGFYRRAIELDADRAEYVNDYGIFLCERKRVPEALAMFKRAAENKFYRTPEYALDNAGVCAMDVELVEVAEKHLRAALKHNPVFAPAMLHMAELTLKKGDAGLADAYHARFLSLGRHTAQSLMVGIDIRRELGDHQAAEEFGQQLLSNYPRSEQAKLYVASQ